MNKKLLFIPLGIALGAVAAGLVYHFHSANEEEEEPCCKKVKKKKKK